MMLQSSPTNAFSLKTWGGGSMKTSAMMYVETLTFGNVTVPLDPPDTVTFGEVTVPLQPPSFHSSFGRGSNFGIQMLDTSDADGNEQLEELDYASMPGLVTASSSDSSNSDSRSSSSSSSDQLSYSSSDDENDNFQNGNSQHGNFENGKNSRFRLNSPFGYFPLLSASKYPQNIFDDAESADDEMDDESDVEDQPTDVEDAKPVAEYSVEQSIDGGDYSSNDINNQSSNPFNYFYIFIITLFSIIYSLVWTFSN